MSRRYAVCFLAGLVISSPWPLGLRLPWASMLFAAVVLLVGVVWLINAIVTDRKLRWSPLLLPAGAFLGWAGLQWLAGWTIYPHATAYEWIRYVSYAIVFALTIDTVRSHRAMNSLAGAIVGTSIAVALFGLIQFFSWNGYVYWVWDPPYGGTRFGPFNNRNYFAGYLVGTIGPAISLLLHGAWRWGPVGAYLAALSALTVFVSLSRAGSLALLCLIGGIVISIPRAESGVRASRWWRPALPVAVAASVLLGLAMMQQTHRVVSRLETIAAFEQETPLRGRLEIWRDSLEMIRDKPITGFGLNTFRWAFAPYNREPETPHPGHAHNEYLEILAETGIIGAAICAWFVFLLFKASLTMIRAARSPWERAVRIGSLASWCGILVYSLADFPTIIPALDYALAVGAGLAVARLDAPKRQPQRATRRKRGPRRPDPTTAHPGAVPRAHLPTGRCTESGDPSPSVSRSIDATPPSMS